MIDYSGFAGRLAACPDRAARWDLLREVQRDWGFVGAGNVWTPPTDPPGPPSDFEDDEDLDGIDLDAVEHDYGYALVVPAAVTEWFAMAENSFLQAPRLYWTHPMDRPCRWPDALTVAVLRHRGVAAEAVPEFHGEFMSEYEACFSWGYRESEAVADDDPPVYILNSARPLAELVEDLADGGDDPGNRVLVARSVTEWALGFALTHLPSGARHLLGTLVEKPDAVDPGLFDRDAVDRHRTGRFGGLTGAQRGRLESAFPELGLLPWHDAGVSTLRGGPDVILCQWEEDESAEDGCGVDIAARTPEAMAAALEVLGVER